MKLLLTADPEIPIPPEYYGGIERIIDMVTRSLVERGHEVHLMAGDGSMPACEVSAWPGRSSLSGFDTLRNSVALTRAVRRGKFDLVHSFSRLAYMAAILPAPIPKLMTYQREITKRTVNAAQKLSRGTLEFSGISQWMVEGVRHIGNWHVVPNGVPLRIYDFNPVAASDAPLVFLGRVEKIKGPHLAIEIAKRSGRNLVIAGNVPEGHRAWADHHVLRHSDGKQIQFVGPVDDKQKNILLGSAAAFLMPILWEEPFGIVMAEAMACGTPVLGMRRGAVPEVVEDGVTGFVRDSVDELVDSVKNITKIDRVACRNRVEALYSDRAVVDGYEAIYMGMIEKAVR